jgi:hypothetical protein
MSGNCENCARRETCKKEIGIIWGFCNADFVPVEKSRDEQEGKR